MKISLNWIKKYVDIPDTITSKQISYDLTVRTVEVESVEDTSLKFHDIVVGKILEVKNHPNADKLRICMVDIGETNPVQIVCGGSNLYVGEYVVVSKPGAEVVWHGEGEPVKITETKMRGESSYGMICASEEVYLDKLFPSEDDHAIVDLKGFETFPGQNIADLLDLNDTIIEIDNKSLTNRPDLWGHYGIAREIAAIYDLKLKELPKAVLPSNLPKYDIEIQDTNKCRRYVGIEIDGIENIESPLWMKVALLNCGFRPINAIVDITNYVMLAVGQPLHAFDKTHVEGNKIIVRNATSGEELLLLDDNVVKLDEDDLVICDIKEPMALAGIKGGKKDSILPTTKGIVLEIANFAAPTIRKSGKKFDEKTDAAIRYEKNIDTSRVDEGIALSLELIKEIFKDSKVVSYGEVYPTKTERSIIDVSKYFLDTRLGKVIEPKEIEKILNNLGYDVEYSNEVYHVTAPVWRSTGDVSLKDDVLGDIARILSYQSFDAKPLTYKVEHSINQRDYLLERRIKEYLANRCGFNEIYTYPWIDIKYINASKLDISKSVRLATPPAPELACLRLSLIPGMLEAISKNLRYYDTFKMFEISEVFEKGEYHESTMEETLPIHKNYLAGSIVGKNPKDIFYELKGILEQISSYTHMEKLNLEKIEKPSWADINAYLNITLNGNIIGSMGLLSMQTMNESKIKHTNVAIFELNMDNLIPYASRTNKYISLPLYPLVEKDLSVIVDKNVNWKNIEDVIKSKVKEVIFIDEYKGDKIPEDKKSITLRVKIGKEDSTMTTDEINEKMNQILKTLNKTCGATLREE